MRLFAVLLLLSISPTLAAKTVAKPDDRRNDEHSYAEPTKVVVKDVALDLSVDFDKKIISGSANLSLTWHKPKYRQLVLDTRDLAIEKIEGTTGRMAWQPLKYSLAPRDAIFGSKLTIAMPQAYSNVRITYSTSSQASGLQWLDAPLTAGKKQPFMFSQSQAIHARSWVPLQDTPGVRFTYSANIKTPKNAMALMSANNAPDAVRDGEYSFRMPQPISSYLLAIAAGDLVFEPISNRVGVWAEPSVVKKAVWEFADTEKMIVETEKMFGPYRWERYDILVLPPSFPFGGMENPRLTFATPTIIVGDRSQTSLIAHELAHSWSGNLVTNSSWKDMWLNEGFTTYVQGRIIEAVYGKDLADMEDVIGEFDAKSEVKNLAPNMQLLALAAMPGVDPDEALTDIAYEKGQWFLTFLEQRYSRELFDPFIRSWFDAHAFKSATTNDFVEFYKKNLPNKKPGAVSEDEFNEWIYKPGIPSFAVETKSQRFIAVDAARTAWLSGKLSAKKIPANIWSTQEWAHFLDNLPKTLPAEKLQELDTAFKLTGTPNGEIAMRWYPLTIRSGYGKARPAITAFLKKSRSSQVNHAQLHRPDRKQGWLGICPDCLCQRAAGLSSDHDWVGRGFAQQDQAIIVG
jgi:leukotriene-A4 hydrolase